MYPYIICLYIWDLFCPEAVQLENSWNVSFRKMYDLPLQTHRYLVELLSKQKHLKKILIKRFLSFLQEITDMKFDQLTLNGFSDEECEEILHFTCTS